MTLTQKNVREDIYIFFILHTFSVFKHMAENDLLGWKSSSFSGGMALRTAGVLWSIEQNEGQCPPPFPCIQTLLPDYVHVRSWSKIPHAP